MDGGGRLDLRTTPSVKRALRDTGLRLLDIEVVWIQPGLPNPDHLRIVDIVAELGARNVLCGSSDPDPAATADKLALMMVLGAAVRIRAHREFGNWREVRTIHDARAILTRIDSPAAGMLFDALQRTRSGSLLADLDALPPRWLGYAQLCCNAPLVEPPSDDPQATLIEAIDSSVPTDRGGLALREFVARLPDGLPLAIEERSKALRDDSRDLADRANTVAVTTRAFLASLAETPVSDGPAVTA